MFRFTIRDVLWLTAVVALSVCWYGERSRAGRLTERLGQTQEQLEAMTEAHDKLATSNGLANAISLLITGGRIPPPPPQGTSDRNKAKATETNPLNPLYFPPPPGSL